MPNVFGGEVRYERVSSWRGVGQRYCPALVVRIALSESLGQWRIGGESKSLVEQ